jgi:hypothetical protein
LWFLQLGASLVLDDHSKFPTLFLVSQDAPQNLTAGTFGNLVDKFDFLDPLVSHFLFFYICDDVFADGCALLEAWFQSNVSLGELATVIVLDANDGNVFDLGVA